MNVGGLTNLLGKLGALGKRFAGAPSVLVGYTQAYAVFVHENLQAKHPVGQAKFLEQPARQLQDVLRQMIRADMARGLEPKQALLRAGLYLQRESQKLVPVLTGALKNSAFTRLEQS